MTLYQRFKIWVAHLLDSLTERIDCSTYAIVAIHKDTLAEHNPLAQELIKRTAYFYNDAYWFKLKDFDAGLIYKSAHLISYTELNTFMYVRFFDRGTPQDRLARGNNSMYPENLDLTSERAPSLKHIDIFDYGSR